MPQHPTFLPPCDSSWAPVIATIYIYGALNQPLKQQLTGYSSPFNQNPLILLSLLRAQPAALRVKFFLNVNFISQQQGWLWKTR